MRHQSLTKTQVSVRLSIAALATLLFVLALGLQSPVYADAPVDDCFGAHCRLTRSTVMFWRRLTTQG